MIIYIYIYMYILSYITYHISRCYVRIPILGWMIIPDLAGHGLTMGWGEPMCWAKVALAPSTCATGETNQARMARGPTRSSISRGYYGFLLCNCGYSWDETGQTCNMPMNSGNNHNDVWFWSFTMFSYSIQWWFWIIDGFFRCQTHPNRIHQHRVSMWFLLCIPLGWSPGKTNLAVGLVDPMRRVRDSCGIHRNPQGSSTHWSVCPKATLSKCAAEMGRGNNLLIFVDKADMAKHWRLTTHLFFLQGNMICTVVGFCRFTDSSVRCAVFQCSLWGWNLGEPLKSSGSWWFSLVDLLFGGGKSLPFSAVFSIAANSYSAVAPKANAEKQVCAEPRSSSQCHVLSADRVDRIWHCLSGLFSGEVYRKSENHREDPMKPGRFPVEFTFNQFRDSREVYESAFCMSSTCSWRCRG